jgi:hypothetical protein
VHDEVYKLIALVILYILILLASIIAVPLSLMFGVIGTVVSISHIATLIISNAFCTYGLLYPRYRENRNVYLSQIALVHPMTYVGVFLTLLAISEIADRI